MSQTINAYGKLLSKEDIDNKVHREFIGGMWEEVGQLQFNFLKENGLLPSHKLLDVGCGSLRGGVHYIKYLAPNNYYGLDINSSLIEAGNIEVETENLLDKNPTLLVNNKFEFFRFEQQFDFAIAQSVFTHLPINHILRCLNEINKVLKTGGVFFSTFFINLFRAI